MMRESLSMFALGLVLALAAYSGLCALFWLAGRIAERWA